MVLPTRKSLSFGTRQKILFPKLVGVERRNQLLKLIAYIESKTRCKFQPSALEAKQDLSNYKGIGPDTNKAYATPKGVADRLHYLYATAVELGGMVG